MSKKYLTIILCILLILTLSPTTFGSSDVVHKSMNGQFTISVLQGKEWIDAGEMGYGKFYSENQIDIGDFIKADGELKVKVTKVGGGAAHIDSIFLEDAAPVKVDEKDGKDLAKVSKDDYDVIDVGEGGLVFTFNAKKGDGILKLNGRIENEVISKTPFKLPINPSEFYNYEMDSNFIISEDIFGDILESQYFLKEYLIPGSGHPSGYIYIWVANDADNLYVKMDFTSDNTMDGEKDYGTVNINTSEGLKEFRITQSDTKWGKANFVYTDKVAYEHKVYDFIIPLEELDSEAEEIDISFRAYGTAAPSDPFEFIPNNEYSVPDIMGEYKVPENIGTLTIELYYFGYSWYNGQTIFLTNDDGSATEGQDYTFTPTQFTFDSDQLCSIEITINDDDLVEGDESFTINFRTENENPSFTGSATITIIDDDEESTIPLEPQFRFSSSTYEVYEGIDDEAIIPVELYFEDSGPIITDLKFMVGVEYLTQGGTADPIINYTPVEGFLIFNNTLEESFSIPIKDNDVAEGDKTVNLYLTNGGFVAMSTDNNPNEDYIDVATLTIIDDDKTVDPDPEPEPEPEPVREREGDRDREPVPAPEPKPEPPKGGVVIRRPHYVKISEPIERNPSKKDEVTIKYSQELLDENEESVPVVCYWNTKYKKWVALTTFNEEEGKAKAWLEGKYKGWFMVYANDQPTLIDIDKDVNENIYLRLNNLGVLEGFSLEDEDMRVVLMNQNMTKAEFSTLVFRLMNLDYSNKLIPSLNVAQREKILTEVYSDSESIPKWYRSIIASLTDQDIVESIDGAFMGGKDISELEAAKIINSAIKLIPNYEDLKFDDFIEDESIAEWAKAALENDSFEAFVDKEMGLDKAISREDALLVLYKFFIIELGW